MSPAEVAVALACSVSTVQRRKREGELGFDVVDDGRRRRVVFKRRHVDAYLAQRAKPPAEATIEEILRPEDWLWVEQQLASAPPLSDQQVRILAAVFAAPVIGPPGQ